MQHRVQRIKLVATILLGKEEEAAKEVKEEEATEVEKELQLHSKQSHAHGRNQKRNPEPYRGYPNPKCNPEPVPG